MYAGTNINCTLYVKLYHVMFALVENGTDKLAQNANGIDIKNSIHGTYNY